MDITQQVKANSGAGLQLDLLFFAEVGLCTTDIIQSRKFCIANSDYFRIWFREEKNYSKISGTSDHTHMYMYTIINVHYACVHIGKSGGKLSHIIFEQLEIISDTF